MRLDTPYIQRQLIAYLKAQGVTPVFSGIVPENQKPPFVHLADGAGVFVNDDLTAMDGGEFDWTLTVVGKTHDQIDVLIIALWAALNRPGEYFDIGTVRTCYCRVTGDTVSTSQEQDGGESSLIEYQLTVRIRIMMKED